MSQNALPLTVFRGYTDSWLSAIRGELVDFRRLGWPPVLVLEVPIASDCRLSISLPVIRGTKGRSRQSGSGSVPQPMDTCLPSGPCTQSSWAVELSRERSRR